MKRQIILLAAAAITLNSTPLWARFAPMEK